MQKIIHVPESASDNIKCMLYEWPNQFNSDDKVHMCNDPGQGKIMPPINGRPTNPVASDE